MTAGATTVDDRPVLVLGPTPTPNGGMHLGHIAGPYLAGDVYARYQRAQGRAVVYTTGTDDNQTYVVATARKAGVTPDELVTRATGEIRADLAAMGISVDGFAPCDDAYRETVGAFFRRLYDAGRFRTRTVRIPRLAASGEFLVEGLVEGECPSCLATSRGGLCETCGHPNYFDDLRDPHATFAPDEPVTTAEATVLVLPLEDYRERLTAYLDDVGRHWRPHVVALAKEMLAGPLPDMPITYPLDRGLPAPFPETPGQVLNAWLETVPSGFHSAAHAAARLGRDTTPGQLWRPAERMRLVHFLGFDYVYIWCLPDIALLMAHGDAVLPESVVPNEFYELESAKFSTSKGHVLTCQDVLREAPRDVVRLYLALTAPEHQRTTFSRAGLALTARRLCDPWNRMVTTLTKAIANAGAEDPLPVTALARTRAATMAERFAAAYEMPWYSLGRAADTVLMHVERLAARAAALDATPLDADPTAWGELFLQVRALLDGAAPILIDLAEASRGPGADTAPPAAADAAQIRPFAPAYLPTGPERTTTVR